ncbi:MAG: hypothetical protein QOK25_1848, partial [Thermoleophilaceae bacterium]|nr:hypothetical protein [Thermoleophilaceae bacterium]
VHDDVRERLGSRIRLAVALRECAEALAVEAKIPELVARKPIAGEEVTRHARGS